MKEARIFGEGGVIPTVVADHPIVPPSSDNLLASMAPPSNWARHLERWGLGLMIALCLVPIWSFARFPSQDGPAHVYNAMILRLYHQPAGAIYRTYVELNPEPSPNLLGHWVMAALQIFVSPAIAEKLLVSAYVVLFPLSIWYAVRATSADHSYLAFLAFPLTYNVLLHDGFYNFCLSLPLFFFLVGFWLRRRGRIDFGSALMLLVLSLLLYFAHVVSLMLACMVAGVLTCSDLVKRTQSVKQALLPMLALTPALCLAAHFLTRQGMHGEAMQPLGWMLRRLIQLRVLVSFHESEKWCARCVGLLFAIVAAGGVWRLIGNRGWVWGDVMLLPLGVGFALYFVTPDSLSGGSGVTPRLMLYCCFLLILWLGCTPIWKPGRSFVPVAASLLCLWMLGTYTLRYSEFNHYLVDYTECADFIKPDSTLLPICLSEHGYTATGVPLAIRDGAAVFMHAGSLLAVERHLVDLSDYEARQNYFPTRFRPGMMPAEQLGYGHGLLDYPRLTGGRGRIDYVLVWNVHEKNLQAKWHADAQRDLDAGYDWIHASPDGFATLYRLKPERR